MVYLVRPVYFLVKTNIKIAKLHISKGLKSKNLLNFILMYILKYYLTFQKQKEKNVDLVHPILFYKVLFDDIIRLDKVKPTNYLKKYKAFVHLVQPIYFIV